MRLIRQSLIPEREATPETMVLRRRSFLQAGAAFSAAALFGCGEDTVRSKASGIWKFCAAKKSRVEQLGSRDELVLSSRKDIVSLDLIESD